MADPYRNSMSDLDVLNQHLDQQTRQLEHAKDLDWLGYLVRLLRGAKASPKTMSAALIQELEQELVKQLEKVRAYDPHFDFKNFLESRPR